MKTRKLVCLLITLLLVCSLVFVACDDKGKGTVVTFWANCNDVELRVFREIVKQFNSDHKGEIYVNLVSKTGDSYSDTLGLTLNGSKAPDVFYVGDAGYKEYAELGYFVRHYSTN